ncbi:3-hydroxyisobutyrate dehydrogenase (plasmid) [Sodalis praecaptivus]|uniref:3-hydroxyisobutyrate dehydrogenase n=1 Tax=Sodalis praecaptivus TaxID=1239307 RepID=W0I3U0_9GAMM|nr:NAD(P)-dependent oxidoreductase [Sodalis praecaptivus]AHF79392.1 3-hydroxyisobutyrate dehydrogenase [Sodalis praecaptivus]
MRKISKVGFIGLGMMGAPMATCLVRAGYEMLLQDADKARTRDLCARLGSRALTKETLDDCDVLITMLPNSDIVEEVLLHNGWASALPRDAVVVDMSSSVPMRSRQLAGEVAAMGLHWLDAPVSGGVNRAAEGQLAIMVGGEPQVLAHCSALLNGMGRSVLHIGGAGAGHAAKALNNFVSAAGLAATVEALHVAQRFGIEPTVMTDVLNASTGRSNTSENKVKQFMLNGRFDSGFALKLMDKDLHIAQALAEDVGYAMTLGRSCTALWHDAAAKATAATDHTEMYRLLADE